MENPTNSPDATLDIYDYEDQDEINKILETLMPIQETDTESKNCQHDMKPQQGRASNNTDSSNERYRDFWPTNGGGGGGSGGVDGGSSRNGDGGGVRSVDGCGTDSESVGRGSCRNGVCGGVKSVDGGGAGSSAGVGGGSIRQNQRTNNDNSWRFRPYMQGPHFDRNRNSQRFNNNNVAGSTLEEGRGCSAKSTFQHTPRQQQVKMPFQQRQSPQQLARQERAVAFEQKQHRKQQQHKQKQLRQQQQQNNNLQHQQQSWLQQQQTSEKPQNFLFPNQQQPLLLQQQQQQQQLALLNFSNGGGLNQIAAPLSLAAPNLAGVNVDQRLGLLNSFSTKHLNLLQLNNGQYLDLDSLYAGLLGATATQPNTAAGSIQSQNMLANFGAMPLDNAGLGQILNLNCNTGNSATAASLLPSSNASNLDCGHQNLLIKALTNALLSDIKPAPATLSTESSACTNQSLTLNGAAIDNLFGSGSANGVSNNSFDDTRNNISAVRGHNSFLNSPCDKLFGMHQSGSAGTGMPFASPNQSVASFNGSVNSDNNSNFLGNFNLEVTGNGSSSLNNFLYGFNGFGDSDVIKMDKMNNSFGNNIPMQNWNLDFPMTMNGSNRLTDFKVRPSNNKVTSTITSSSLNVEPRPRTIADVVGLSQEEIFSTPTRRVLDLVRDLGMGPLSEQEMPDEIN